MYCVSVRTCKPYHFLEKLALRVVQLGRRKMNEGGSQEGLESLQDNARDPVQEVRKKKKSSRRRRRRRREDEEDEEEEEEEEEGGGAGEGGGYIILRFRLFEKRLEGIYHFLGLC